MLKTALSTYGLLPIVLILMLLEIIILGKKVSKHYRLNDTITNIHIQLGFLVFKIFFGASFLALYGFAFKNLSIFHIENNKYTFVLCLLLCDLAFYWTHRLSHRFSFLWSSHVVHHQSEEMNLSVPLRTGWLENFAVYMIFFLPLAVIGFTPKMFFFTASLIVVYSYFCHTALNIRFPKWLNRIIATPEYHLLHHCRNESYIDKNFALTFIFYDILFGTFAAPEEAPEIGLDKPLESWNPIQNNFVFFNKMLARFKNEKGILNKVKVFFTSPENIYANDLPEPKVVHQKFDASASSGLNFYCLIQTAFLILFFLTYLSNLNNLDFLQMSLIGLFMLASGTMISGILEQKKWASWTEPLRIIALVVIYLFFLNHSILVGKYLANILVIGICITSFFWYFIESFKVKNYLY